MNRRAESRIRVFQGVKTRMNRFTRLGFTVAAILLIGIAVNAKLIAAAHSRPSTTAANHPSDRAILDNYGKLPLSFERNEGQADKRVQFLSRGAGYSVYLTNGEATLALAGKQAADHDPD